MEKNVWYVENCIEAKNSYYMTEFLLLVERKYSIKIKNMLHILEINLYIYKSVCKYIKLWIKN